MKINVGSVGHVNKYGLTIYLLNDYYAHNELRLSINNPVNNSVNDIHDIINKTD